VRIDTSYTRQVANCLSPIFTYSGRGTSKPGVDPSEHAVAYSYGTFPQLLHGEQPLEKHPICIVMTEKERPMPEASRIRFGVYHPVQYNVKVKDLGYVHPDWVPTILGYWNKEQDTADGQEIEVKTRYEEDCENEDPDHGSGGYDAARGHGYA
jgi:hypothetical protein